MLKILTRRCCPPSSDGSQLAFESITNIREIWQLNWCHCCNGRTQSHQGNVVLLLIIRRRLQWNIIRFRKPFLKNILSSQNCSLDAKEICWHFWLQNQFHRLPTRCWLSPAMYWWKTQEHCLSKKTERRSFHWKVNRNGSLNKFLLYLIKQWAAVMMTEGEIKVPPQKKLPLRRKRAYENADS